ncbi:hypothetical protein ACFOW6_05190 [Fodinicurvata halophila]|uniref:Cell division protein ZapB n=1 Tax=Fodinicurvata halophila TaxID=1419723 RepID=A0ABV8UI32_9PROT
MPSNDSPTSSEETQDSATVDDAALRLERALDTLEKLIEEKTARITELNKALEIAETENKDLKQRLEQASEKVDTVTRRLQETLEDKG